MLLPRSDSRLLVWSAAFLVTLAACGSGTGEGGSPGSGGSASGGATGSGGTTGSGGAGPSTGGNSGSGTGGNGTGGAGPTGGSVGSGGHATGGAGGSTSGTGGGGGTGTGTGGAGGRGTGGVGTGGLGGRGTGGAAAGGHAGTGAGGSETGTGGAGGSGTGAGGSGAMSSGCGKAPTLASNTYNSGMPISITAANLQRRYILSVPTNYDNTKPYKLVVAYHARDSNDHSVYNEKYYGMLPLSNNTTIFVAPNGQKNGAPCSGTGSGDSSCGWPNTSDQDMQLADAVVKQVEDNFCVDTNRIFATGWSYGASMSEQTACERPLSGAGATNPWGVRAIAIYSVAYLSNTDNCKASSSKPVAYYASHGTNDTVLTVQRNGQVLDVDADLGGGGRLHSGDSEGQATWQSRLHQADLAACSAGYPVEFCSFVGPHTPDPTDSGQSKSWEYQNVWTFLSQF